MEGIVLDALLDSGILSCPSGLACDRISRTFPNGLPQAVFTNTQKQKLKIVNEVKRNMSETTANSTSATPRERVRLRVAPIDLLVPGISKSFQKQNTADVSAAIEVAMFSCKSRWDGISPFGF